MKAVIFDMDGVLTDSSPIHEWAFRETLRPYGIEVDYRRIAGMRSLDAVRLLLAENGVRGAEAEMLAAAKTEMALRRMCEQNPVVPGALDVVERLSARYPIALASSGSRQSVDAFLDLNDARELFQVVLNGGDVRAAKPAPDIYLEASRRLGIEARECLVVEDSVAGAEAARAAGCEVRMVTACLEDLGGLLATWGSLAVQGDRPTWSAVIPAAGRGSRLGFELPKVLFPVAGRTILEWLVRLLKPICSRAIVVASPDGASIISQHLKQLWPGGEVAVQASPVGMADAVQCALPLLRTSHALIVWGDQAAVKAESLKQCVRMHEDLAPLATVPTAMRDKPYIHFERDAAGRVIRVLQARENDILPDRGESDSGVFCFRSIALRRLLKELARSGAGVGRQTGEFNFLPVLPIASRLPGSLLTPEIMTAEESIGVNSREDAEVLAGILRSRKA